MLPGVSPKALADLTASGYKPTSLEEARRDAGSLLGVRPFSDVVTFFLTGRGDVIET
jgi:hypothetical protein